MEHSPQYLVCEHKANNIAHAIKSEDEEDIPALVQEYIEASVSLSYGEIVALHATTMRKIGDAVQDMIEH